MAKILVPLAQGFEEIEFISVCDILRRAKCEVIIASLDENLLVSGAHDIKIQADCAVQNVNIARLDGIALAGGYNGMLNLKSNSTILNIIKKLHESKKLVAAICASPIVLNEAGIFGADTKFTCYPGCENGLCGERIDTAVYKMDNIITSAGPATATKFALEIVAYLYGSDIKKALENELLMELATK